MKIAVICFSPQGVETIEKLYQRHEPKEELELFCKAGTADTLPENCRVPDCTLAEWTERQFRAGNALLFIGAAGIAVRAIAPFLENKLTDPPVLVMDDNARYVIPVLSGHYGGANELAVKIAEEMDAVPVISTSTDVNRKFAVDVFAKKNGLFIRRKEGIAKISAKVLQGRQILIGVSKKLETDEASFERFCEKHPGEVVLKTGLDGSRPDAMDVDVWIGYAGEPAPEAELVLEKKPFILGIGCKKGKPEAEIQSFIKRILEKAGILPELVACAASVDRKKDEEGLVRFAESTSLPFLTFSPETLAAVPGTFSESEFVRAQVGVGNVAERSAMAACEGNGEIVLPKQAENGMTAAVVRDRRPLVFTETQE